MGNQLASQLSQIDHHLHDLPGIVYESTLGKGWLLKTLRCIHDEGTLIVKVFIKKDQNQSLKEQEDRLDEIRERFNLIENSNVLAFQRWEKTENGAYLIRQYFINNLYDRISTRPFLTPIEKRWIVFQLLTALEQCHRYDICHGDIKSENVMVTSWNWIYLTDFASYKPALIPEDDPADFSYFFDTSGRRSCYIAPERFYGGPKPAGGKISTTMDLFSLGCVIAELFLDGTPIFDFPQLHSYRRGEYDPHILINKISDTTIQDLVKHMIQRDPEKRYKRARDYLDAWSGKAFPEYFPDLHKYISMLMSLDSDDKIDAVHNDFSTLLSRFVGSNKAGSAAVDTKSDDESGDEDEDIVSPKPAETNKMGIHEKVGDDLLQGVKKTDPTFALTLETERYIHKLETDSLNANLTKAKPPPAENRTSRSLSSSSKTALPIINSNTFVESPPSFSSSAAVALSDKAVAVNTATSFVPPPESEGFIMILNVICSFVHTVRFPSTKLTALELFSQFAKYLDSEIRLQRIVPYVVSLLSEERALVRATALRVLTAVLEKVEIFSPSDSHVFPAYILPAVGKFSSEEPEELVREAYAECLAQLAEVARRFLETSQFFKQSSDISSQDKDLLSYQESYDAELTEIQDAFYEVVVEMLTKDTSTAVKVTLLSDITRLCIFFGRQKTNDFLLPLIITFLNDRHDWELRCAFLNNIVGVSAFVGMDSLEHFILPCLLQALTDEEEFVIDKAVNSLASLCELRLFRKHKLFDIAEKTAPMLYHPNIWIRYGVIAIMSAIATQLKLADIHCFLIPALRPFLVTDIIEITEANLLEALKPPLSRAAFDQALICAFNVLSKLDFSSSQDFAPEHGSKKFNVNSSISQNATSPSSVRDSISLKKMSEVELDPFDSGLLRSLIELKVSKEEEEKIFTMRSFIRSASRTSQRKGMIQESRAPSAMFANLSSMVNLHSIPIPNMSEKKYLTSRVRQSAANPSSPKALSKSTSNVNFKTSSAGSTKQGTWKIKPGDPNKSLRGEDWRYMFQQSGGVTTPPKKIVHTLSPSASESKIKPIHTITDYSPATTNNKGTKLFTPSLPPHLISPPMPDLGSLSVDYSPANPPIEAIKDWQPKGILVAHLHEHKSSINQIQVTQDNMFFVSGSDDGTVKIWDCRRLEKNVTNRSRLTYSSQGGKIKAITICEASHSVASGSDNGTIHVFRIEYTTKKDSTLNRYSGVSTVKNIDSGDGAIMGIDHFNTDSTSLLVYATNHGKLHSWDLRAKKEPWCLLNPSNLGLLETFVVEPGRNWLVTGTSSGYFTVWDMRFHIPVKSWRLPSKNRIHRLSHYNSGKNNSWIFCTSGNANDLTVWDVETSSCKQYFRVLTTDDNVPLPSLKVTETSDTLESAIEELQRPQFFSLATAENYQHSGSSVPSSPHVTSTGIKAMINPVDSPYLITAGDDKRIRFWNLQNSVQSFNVCGLTNDQPKPRYSSHVADNVTVFQEHPNLSESAAAQGLPNISKLRGPSSATVNHHESILDVKLMEYPHRMLLSAGRDGVVKVYYWPLKDERHGPKSLKV